MPTYQLDHKVYVILIQVQKQISLNTDKEVKFSLEQAMKAQRGNRGIALLFL